MDFSQSHTASDTQFLAADEQPLGSASQMKAQKSQRNRIIFEQP
jgi:hypothetical protein